MNLMAEVEKIKEGGYSEANAEARLCQDIIINAISKSSLSRNITIKGGVVMRSLSRNARRATQDIDLDFIRYSISETSIKIFIEKLNCLSGIQLSVVAPMKQLNHQDYKGLRIFIDVSDEEGNVLTSKMDIGVHKDLSIEQEEYCFDIFDICYLSEYVDMEQLKHCAQRYIYDDVTLQVSNSEEIRNRMESIFNNSAFKKSVERSRKNWLDLSVDEVFEKNMKFIYLLCQ